MLKKILNVAMVATGSFLISAQAAQFGPPIQTSVVVTKTMLKGDQTNAGTQTKTVTLINYQLTEKEKASFFNYQPSLFPEHHTSKHHLPTTVYLGMNNVPVLDQGRHGSCVTFANTGAIDAVLNKGDAVSQLCLLSLGKNLENSSFMPSGWNGSYGPWILDEILRFGLVSKEDQIAKGCASVNEYPRTDAWNEGNPMSSDDYRQMSEDMNQYFYPVYMMNFFERSDARFSSTNQAEEVLHKTKEALARGDRLTFGTLLIISPYCSAGACASYHSKFDTWALTQEIETPPYDTAGHEMIIIGYDDHAVLFDKHGKMHKGLLALRNSWGEDVGNHGEYYMTYDYFKKFVGEVQEIVPVTSPMQQ